MSRSVPWRNKPTQLIIQMLPVSSQMKLYLVNQIGPTSFVFKDENENKFKVIIGAKLSCSCAIVENDHCIHTLYVMLKKYKVPENNAIIWQASYLDSELEGMIQLKYMEKKKEVASKFKPRKKKQLILSQNGQEFPILDQDQTCPICYEDMVQQCYSSCSTCKKCIHTKCLKVWVKHKQDNNQSVTCPMCRSQFHNPMGIVNADMQRWEKRFVIHKGTCCKSCGIKNIKGLIYKCLMCPNTDLCKFCFQGNQHLEHDKYFVKEMTFESWKIAPMRVKKSKNQLFEAINEIQTRGLPNDITSIEFIMNLFQTVKQHNGIQNVQTLGIVGNQMLMKQICFKCRRPGDESMKRLRCGHTVHASCLYEMIGNEDFVCQVDQEVICPGYLNALEIKVKTGNKNIVNTTLIQKQKQIKKIKQKIVVDERYNQKYKVSSISKNITKSKQKSFRILKKSAGDRRAQIDQLGIGNGFRNPIMITGLNSLNSIGPSHLMPPPKPLNQKRNQTFLHPF